MVYSVVRRSIPLWRFFVKSFQLAQRPYSYKDGKSFFYNLETRINSELIALDNRYTPFINFGGWLRRNLKQIACESQNYGISLWNIADKSLDRTLEPVQKVNSLGEAFQQ
jgi:hypothetical protein